QARDIHEFDYRRRHFLRFRDRGDALQARVGHRHDADIGLDGAERVILGRNRGLGKRIEQRGLADVGQAHDTALEAHFLGVWPESGRNFLKNEPSAPGLPVFSGSRSALPAGWSLPAFRAGFGCSGAWAGAAFAAFFGFSGDAARSGAAWLCSFSIAPWRSPESTRGRISSPAPIAVSIAARSSCAGLFST